MEREWSTWQPTDPDSPGRIDASCVLVYGLIPEANAGAIVHAPLPQAPRAAAPAAAYRAVCSRTGRHPRTGAVSAGSRPRACGTAVALVG